MNRADIVAKMALREKEIFEKYKDTYPFPAKEFSEEIGIKIIKNGSDFCLKKDKDQYVINIPCESLEYQSDRNSICMGLISYFFDDIHLIDTTVAICALLMSTEFIKASFESGLSVEKIEEVANIADVPIGILMYYITYLGITDEHLKETL